MNPQPVILKVNVQVGNGLVYGEQRTQFVPISLAVEII